MSSDGDRTLHASRQLLLNPALLAGLFRFGGMTSELPVNRELGCLGPRRDAEFVCSLMPLAGIKWRHYARFWSKPRETESVGHFNI